MSEEKERSEEELKKLGEKLVREINESPYYNPTKPVILHKTADPTDDLPETTMGLIHKTVDEIRGIEGFVPNDMLVLYEANIDEFSIVHKAQKVIDSDDQIAYQIGTILNKHLFSKEIYNVNFFESHSLFTPQEADLLPEEAKVVSASWHFLVDPPEEHEDDGNI